jgi:phage baseplate assembly protein W
MNLLPRTDFAYPFRVDPASQQTGQASYGEHVNQMVRQLLLTTPGERVDLPQFGCGLRALVFAPITDALAATVQLQVLQSLEQWLAGIVSVNEVTVDSSAQDESLAPGTIKVTVAYTVLDTQVPASTTVILQ